MVKKPKVIASTLGVCHQEVGWLHNLISCYLADTSGRTIEQSVAAFLDTQGETARNWLLEGSV